MPNPVTPFTRSAYGWLAVCAILIAALLLEAGLMSDYFTSRYLYKDDVIYIGKYAFGLVAGAPSNAFHYYVLEALTDLEQLWRVKLLLLVFPAIVGLSTTSILVSAGLRKLPAVMVGIFATQYPVSVDLNFFLTGSHPLAGTAFFSIFLALAAHQHLRSSFSNRAVALLSLGGQAVCLYLASQFSPIFTLAPFILIVSVAILALRAIGRKGFPLWLIGAGLLAVALAVFHAQSFGEYHYSAYVGWTDYSAGQVLANLVAALHQILLEPFQRYPVIALAYLLGFVLILAVVILGLRRPEPSGPLLRPGLVGFAFILVLGAALSFGPSAIVTQFASRYVIGPAYLGFLVIAVILASLWRGEGARMARYNGLALAGLGLMAATSIGHNFAETRAELTPYLRGHKVLAEQIETRDWAPGDQILAILPEGTLSTSSGFNHWSTWYLRLMTGQEDMIGLVGPSFYLGDLRRNGVFVDTYADFGDEYWEVIDNRSARKRMLGLERDRPLYAFVPAPDGRLAPAPVTLWLDTDFISLQPGESFDGVMRADHGQTVTCSADAGDSLMIINAPSIPRSVVFDPVQTVQFEADGASERKVTIDAPEDRLVQLAITLQEAQGARPATAAYTDTTPPMPVLGPAISLAMMPTGYRLDSRDGAMRLQLPQPPEAPFSMTLTGCPGKFALLSVNGATAGLLEGNPFSGDWTLGHGYLNRYWKGEVTRFQLSIAQPAGEGDTPGLPAEEPPE